MKIIPDILTFDWDEGNSNKNLVKHIVTVQESEEVFTNQPLIIATDEKHSTSEQRFLALGRTNKDRKLFLSFTIRKDKIRIISIRDINRKETKIYETH
ncbi:hypothetical protein COT86_02270 [Candidatus Collierbacteria bacterium CG10_big_fil_rev_8_21_14_0_10_43_36]|uniref:BrnT family toxin n=3 Tax=Candidatus Collieribacteriota TaxID=1752725 RepID=A0A2H0DSX9_9BACT|nr:MAG: hypothetical protein COW83_05160 [Candidatus Collierbacteria bacterium CG22_combo_CG10-13_8_21_14_all_43_12]PIR99760.1 MAG: hypothetical protein COT86_02270 [Candidatus Collierbacteria bacterium CG10_big_fil_rev_8_21_14_0_10_43_36]PIZ24800.1 MAG: hypothetical protein COY48_01005 [Candidatus Collierbacteria bacterium CG_4_10_14_0_8_um_filter_43_86]PJB47134.1 MAG: hypothetical protein CO104_04430 [Candidatus Collierbacteria bacterium CG_4_9_14_3_um_filter_43_16]